MRHNFFVVLAIGALLAQGTLAQWPNGIPTRCPTLAINSPLTAETSVVSASTSMIGFGSATQAFGTALYGKDHLTNPTLYAGWTNSATVGTGYNQYFYDTTSNATLIAQANQNFASAYACLAARTATVSDTTSTSLPIQLNPGVYNFLQPMQWTGTVTLNGSGSADSLFILRAPSWTIAPTAAWQSINNGNPQNVHILGTTGNPAFSCTNSVGLFAHLYSGGGIVSLSTCNGNVTIYAPTVSNSNSRINGYGCTVNACTAPIIPSGAPVAPPPVAPPVAPSTFSCPALGSAVGYALVDSTSVSIGGVSSNFIGSVASAYGTVSGIPPSTISSGTVQNSTSAALSAYLDLSNIATFNAGFFQNSNCTFISQGTYNNAVFTPGMYCTPNPASDILTFTGTLTLNAQSTAAAPFFFYSGSIVFGTNLAMNLANGAVAGNVVWNGNNVMTIGDGVSGAGVVLGSSIVLSAPGSTHNVTWLGAFGPKQGTALNNNVTLIAQNCTVASYIYVPPPPPPFAPPPIAAPVSPPVSPPIAPPTVPTVPIATPFQNQQTSTNSAAIAGAVLGGVAVVVSLAVAFKLWSMYNSRYARA